MGQAAGPGCGDCLSKGQLGMHCEAEPVGYLPHGPPEGKGDEAPTCGCLLLEFPSMDAHLSMGKATGGA